MGEFAGARQHAERACHLYDPAAIESYRAVYPAPDLRLGALFMAAYAMCCLGYPETCLAHAGEAVALARMLADPFNLMMALTISAMVHCLYRSGETSLRLADEAMHIAMERGFQQWLAFPLACRGSALIQLNCAEEGVTQLREGVAAYRATGAEGRMTDLLGSLAEGCAHSGRMAEGLQAVAEGLALSEKTGQRRYDAELYRIRGELLLKQDTDANAENEAYACFRQALEIARGQQAKWWELRATVSLARLLAKQGRRDEARTMLSGIYNWFTEGFDSADLKEAKALLDELTA
jgi:tetratricopeptide (TPR) repeat protein